MTSNALGQWQDAKDCRGQSPRIRVRLWWQYRPAQIWSSFCEGIRKIGSLCEQYVLGEDGEMAVMAFDHRIQTMTDFTSDADKVSAAFKQLKPGSSQSHLNDAAMEGVNRLRKRDKSRRRILLLISESRDAGCSMRVRDVLTEAEFQDVVVYTVEVSHLLTSLTSHPDPPRPSPIPPEARHLPVGVIGNLTTDSQGAICCSPSMGVYVSNIQRTVRVGEEHLCCESSREVYTRSSPAGASIPI